MRASPDKSHDELPGPVCLEQPGSHRPKKSSQLKQTNTAAALWLWIKLSQKERWEQPFSFPAVFKSPAKRKAQRDNWFEVQEAKKQEEVYLFGSHKTVSGEIWRWIYFDVVFFKAFQQVNEWEYANQNDACTYSSSQHWESSQCTEWAPGCQLKAHRPRPPASAPPPAKLQANKHSVCWVKLSAYLIDRDLDLHWYLDARVSFKWHWRTFSAFFSLHISDLTNTHTSQCP